MFKVLEVKAQQPEQDEKANQAVGKNYQELSDLLKKQFRKLSLVHHPDKGGNKNRFDQIYKTYQEFKKYIEPLKSGNTCVKVDAHAESDWRLTKKEFHHRDKLFAKLNITKEEAVGEDFQELISILKRKDSSFEENLKIREELISSIQYNSNGAIEEKIQETFIKT